MSSRKNKAVEIKQYGLNLGADLVGIADAAKLNQDAPERHRPEDFLPKAKSVVVIGLRLLDPVMSALPISRLEYTLMFYTVNNWLNHLAYAIARKLEAAGYPSYTLSYSPKEAGVPRQDPKELYDTISYKHAAVYAGLGQYGFNHLLITPQFGPRVRLVALVTEAELEPDSQLAPTICRPAECGYRCVKACPATCLDEDGKLNRFKCQNYLSSVLKVYKCGQCAAACPVDLIKNDWKSPTP
jgi:epoxyqueuosine reductase